MCENVPFAVTELPAWAPAAHVPCRRSSCLDQSMIPYTFDSIGVPVLSRVVKVALTGQTDSAALAALLIGTMRMRKRGVGEAGSLDQTSVSPSPPTPAKVLANAVFDPCSSRGSTDPSVEDGWNVNSPIAEAAATIPLNSNIFCSVSGVAKKEIAPT
jgi:hypothetical protein